MFSQEEKDLILLKKKQLGELFNEKLQIFEDEIKDFIYSKCVVTGGVSASLFLNELVNDIDIYFPDSNDIQKFERFVHNKQDIIQEVKDSNYFIEGQTVSGKVITSRAITFNNGLQVIVMDNSENMRKSFDFVHTLPLYIPSENSYFISEKQFYSIMTKTLIPNEGIEITEKRIQKFVERGWTYD